MDEPPTLGMRPEGGGIGPVDRGRSGGPYRVVLTEPALEHTSEPSLQELREALVGAYGTDFGVLLPVIGEVTAPSAVLIRPDGHVAWAGAGADPGLPRAIATWFGAGLS